MQTLIIIGCSITVLGLIFLFWKRSQECCEQTNWYPIVDVFNPFINPIKNIYYNLSPENKGAFWSVAATIALGVLTCWLGFSVQVFVYDSAKEESAKLAHFQVVDKLKPMYEELFDSCSTEIHKVLYKDVITNGIESSKISEKEILKFCKTKKDSINENNENLNTIQLLLEEKNWDNIFHAANKCSDVSTKIAPYLNEEKRTKLLVNNTKIFLGHSIYSLSNEKLDSITYCHRLSIAISEGILKNQLSYNKHWGEVIQESYTVYKGLYHYRILKEYSVGKKASYKKTMLSILQDYTLIPMYENILVFLDELSSKEESNYIYKSILVLVLSLFIGFIIFRYIVMKFFTGKALTHEDKTLENEIKNLLKEKKLADIHIMALQEKLRNLERDIKSLEQKYSILNSDYEDLTQEKLQAETTCKELHQQYEDLKEKYERLQSENNENNNTSSDEEE